MMTQIFHTSIITLTIINLKKMWLDANLVTFDLMQLNQMAVKSFTSYNYISTTGFEW